MAEMTFESTARGDTRTVEGEISTDENGNLILSEPEEYRPNWRIEGDDVALLSANTGHEIEGFGRNPRFSGYCIQHNVHTERLSGHDSCPKCRMIRDVEAREMERMARRSDPDMHPSVDAPRH